MKPSSRTSSSSKKKKRAVRNAKKKITNKNRRLSISSAKETLKRSSSRRRANVAGEPDKLFWIIISNVHDNVAYEDIVQALFQRCAKLKSKGVDLGGHFQDSIEVAFETKKDAKEAVDGFQNKIRLFRKIWRIHHHKPEASSDAASSTGLRIPDVQAAPESSDDKLLASLQQTILATAVGTGESTKVYITNIDEKVPIEVVVPLFKTVGKVKSHEVYNNSDGIFQGTVELDYERREDAADAIRLFDDNITFFGKTWFITHGDDADADA